MAAKKTPPPPADPVAQDAIDALAADIRAALERANARLPEGLRDNATIIANVLNQELDAVSFTGWKAQIITEFVQLVQSGKSDVKHDPTELA